VALAKQMGSETIELIESRLEEKFPSARAPSDAE
jgi:hypothetical protein